MLSNANNDQDFLDSYTNITKKRRREVDEKEGIEPRYVSYSSRKIIDTVKPGIRVTQNHDFLFQDNTEVVNEEVPEKSRIFLGLSETLYNSENVGNPFPYVNDHNTLNFSQSPSEIEKDLLWDSQDGFHSLPLPSLGLEEFSNEDVSCLSVFNQKTQIRPDSIHAMSLVNTDNTCDQNPKNISLLSESLKEAQEKYMTFAPLFTGINGSNFKELLVKVLHECLHQISLDDFYNLLYNFETPDQVVSSPADGLKIDNSEPSESRMEGLNLCHLILENFRLPDTGKRRSIKSKDTPLISVNFQDICKNFLVIKIIFDSLKVDEDNSKPEHYILRTSVYKAYYIICKKLFNKYSNGSNPPNLQHNLILNQSQLGKIVKLIFPGLNSKRFGGRGGSTYYYQCMAWNNAIIDENIKLLVGLSLSDIDSNFEMLQDKQVKVLCPSEIGPLFGGNIIPIPNSYYKMQILRMKGPTKTPIYSFVDSSTTLPTSKCFPRSWESAPGTRPQQSQWTKEIIKKSVKALKNHYIDIEPLVCKIDPMVFCAESIDTFFEDVLLTIRLLLVKSAPDECYLHLYLVVSTLIFPIGFASDKEVPRRDKFQLRESLTNFVTRLESSFSDLSSFNSLMSFASIMKKMITFNNLVLAQYRSTYTRRIIQAMVVDTHLGSSQEEISFEDLSLRQVLITCNAFDWGFVDAELRQNTNTRILIINNIWNAYMKLVFATREGFLQIPELMTDEDLDLENFDLLYHLLRCVTRNFHEVFLPQPSILQLPIKLANYLLISIAKEVQNRSFIQFSKREVNLSRDIFRIWWVYSNTVQDYLDILSEIAALAGRLQ